MSFLLRFYTFPGKAFIFPTAHLEMKLLHYFLLCAFPSPLIYSQQSVLLSARPCGCAPVVPHMNIKNGNGLKPSIPFGHLPLIAKQCLT